MWRSGRRTSKHPHLRPEHIWLGWVLPSMADGQDVLRILACDRSLECEDSSDEAVRMLPTELLQRHVERDLAAAQLTCEHEGEALAVRLGAGRARNGLGLGAAHGSICKGTRALNTHTQHHALTRARSQTPSPRAQPSRLPKTTHAHIARRRGRVPVRRRVEGVVVTMNMHAGVSLFTQHACCYHDRMQPTPPTLQRDAQRAHRQADLPTTRTGEGRVPCGGEGGWLP